MFSFSAKVLHWLWLVYQLVSWRMCRHHGEEGQEDGRLHLCGVQKGSGEQHRRALLHLSDSVWRVPVSTWSRLCGAFHKLSNTDAALSVIAKIQSMESAFPKHNNRIPFLSLRTTGLGFLLQKVSSVLLFFRELLYIFLCIFSYWKECFTFNLLSLGDLSIFSLAWLFLTETDRGADFSRTLLFLH